MVPIISISSLPATIQQVAPAPRIQKGTFDATTRCGLSALMTLIMVVNVHDMCLNADDNDKNVHDTRNSTRPCRTLGGGDRVMFSGT